MIFFYQIDYAASILLCTDSGGYKFIDAYL